MVTNIVPSNPIAAFVTGNLLQILFVVILFVVILFASIMVSSVSKYPVLREFFEE